MAGLATALKAEAKKTVNAVLRDAINPEHADYANTEKPESVSLSYQEARSTCSKENVKPDFEVLWKTGISKEGKPETWEFG